MEAQDAKLYFESVLHQLLGNSKGAIRCHIMPTEDRLLTKKWVLELSRLFQFTSVSHTQTKHTSFMLAVGADQPIGVDVEWAQRKTHPRLLSKLIDPELDKSGLTPLEYWVIKEAAFKANSKNKETFLSHYSIKEWNPLKQQGQVKACSHFTGQFQISYWKSWVMALVCV